jgi:hypothetical protein
MAPGRIYPLAGYHNYGMKDAPLLSTTGLKPGMTVAIHDNIHGGFYETFARLTWVESHWVGLDTGLASDYYAEQQPELITSYPLIFGRGVERVGVRNLTLDGQRALQPGGIGSCRGAAIYFYGTRHFDVINVTERSFAGEGLGFQMCSHGRIHHCRFDDNAGNAYHPGAGSTGAEFLDCVAEGNARAGFFFCVRANHITVRNCTFAANVECGMSVGTRDSHNRIEHCHMHHNLGPGLLFREGPRPVEVHSVLVRQCTLEGNASASGQGQIVVLGSAHDIALQENTLIGPEGIEKAGIWLAPSTSDIWLYGNHMRHCVPPISALQTSLARSLPAFECGYEAMHQVHTAHLPLVESQSL